MNIFKKTVVTPTLRISLSVLALWAAHTQAQLGCTNENTAIPASTPTADFTLHNDGTATHKTTGLMWMRCSYGQTWDGSNCTGASSAVLWIGALSVSQYGFAGYSDWRLPNIKELASIVEHRCYNPSINPVVFPNTPHSEYWSSSPLEYSAFNVWYVTFNNGRVSFLSKSNTFRVRLVRSGN